MFGNVVVWYQFLLAARIIGKPSLVWAALACSDVLADDERGRGEGRAGRSSGDRSFWEKTVHGLDGDDAHDSAVQHSAGTSTPPAPVQAVPM